MSKHSSRDMWSASSNCTCSLYFLGAVKVDRKNETSFETHSLLKMYLPNVPKQELKTFTILDDTSLCLLEKFYQNPQKSFIYDITSKVKHLCRHYLNIKMYVQCINCNTRFVRPFLFLSYTVSVCNDLTFQLQIWYQKRCKKEPYCSW